MSLSERLLAEFDTECPYAALGVDSSATAGQIKKAFFRAALQWHPDKNPAPEATSKFQILSQVHTILSDEERRGLYDRTGDLDSAGMSEDAKEWYDYWRSLFPRVTEADVESYGETYKGGDEEKADVLRVFGEAARGKVRKALLESVILAEEEDLERFFDIIDAAVAAGEVAARSDWVRPAPGRASKKAKKKSSKKRAKEAEEAEELRRMIMARRGMGGMGGMGAAAAPEAGTVTKRQREFEAMADDMMARYGGGGRGGGKKRKGRKGALPAEPSEEEFAAAQARLGL